MAAIIRAGGKSPLAVKSWQDYVKVTLMEKISDDRSANINNLEHVIMSSIHYGFISSQWNHGIKHNEIIDILIEMFREGWIQVSHFKCECCKEKVFDPSEIMKHAIAFELTSEGYNKVPEHIFP